MVMKDKNTYIDLLNSSCRLIHKGVFKPLLQVNTLSKSVFLSGIGVGLACAVVLSLFFNYGRELMRYHFSMANNLVEISPERYQVYGLFFAAFSLSLGSNLMLWVWSKGVRERNHRLRNHLRLAGLYAFFIVWMLLEVFVNFTFGTSFGLYGYWGEQTVPVITGVQSSVLYLLPLTIFLHGWHSIRFYFRSMHWMLYNLIAVMVLVFPLSWMTLPDQEVVENLYDSRYKPAYHFLDSLLQQAGQRYDIHFTAREENVLRQFSTHSAQEQLARVKEAFASQSPVSLRDVLILRISVHNLRPKGRYYDFNNYWPYPKPEDLYRQLSYFAPGSDEAEEMILTIKAWVQLYNTRLCVPLESGSRNLRHDTFQHNLFRSITTVDSLKAFVDTINAGDTLRKLYGPLPVPDNEKRR